MFLALPGRVRPEAIEGKSTVFHFDLPGEGGGQFTVTIDNGVLTTQEGLVGEPKCTVKANSADFIKIVKGELNAMQAFFFGKISVSNPAEMLAYTKLFGIG